MPITIEIGGGEVFDWNTDEIITVKPTVLEMEHSLISLSKWESKWKVSFMDESEKQRLTRDQILDYFQCMCIKPVKDPNIFRSMKATDEQKILAYISDSMTATTFKDNPKEGRPRRPKKKEIITSEIIYYWMVELGIPFECKTWHLNRLLTLIRVCQEKQVVPNKMKKNDILGMYAAQNAKARAKAKR